MLKGNYMHLIMFDLDGTLLKSNSLDIHFIGIGFYNNEVQLRQEGASHILNDYSDKEASGKVLGRINDTHCLVKSVTSSDVDEPPDTNQQLTSP